MDPQKLTEAEWVQEDAQRRRERRWAFQRGLNIFLLLAASILFFFLILRIDVVNRLLSGIVKTLMPIIYGVAIAYLMNPLVSRLQRILKRFWVKRLKSEERARKTAKAMSIVLGMLTGVAIVTVLLLLVIPELYYSISGLIEKLPDQVMNLIDSVSQWDVSQYEWLARAESYLEFALGDVAQWLQTNLMGIMNNVMNYLVSGVTDILVSVVSILIGFIVSVYVLIDKEHFKAQSKKLLYAVFPVRYANRIMDTARHGHRIFGGFLYGKIIDSLIIGAITLVFMLIFRLPYAMLISVIVGVTNIIPYFGPFIGGIPSAVLLLLADPGQGLTFIIFIIILQQIDGNIIGPRILGTTTGISTFWVTLALFLFGGLMGFTGMIIGVPLFAVLYYIIKTLVERRLEAKNLPVDSSEYSDIERIEQTGPYYTVHKFSQKEEKSQE